MNKNEVREIVLATAKDQGLTEREAAKMLLGFLEVTEDMTDEEYAGFIDACVLLKGITTGYVQ